MLGPCLLLVSLSVAADPATPPTFTLNSASVPSMTGAVARLNKDWSVALAGDKGSVPAGDLIALRRDDVKLPPFPAGPQLIFANGDRLPAEVWAIEKDQVRFRPLLSEAAPRALADEMSVPLAALSEIWFTTLPESENARVWSGERRRRDVVLMNNGDTRSGTLAALPAARDALIIKEGPKEIRLEPAQVVAIALNTDLARALRPRGAFVRVVLVNGARLSLAAAEADGQTLTGTTLFGAKVTIPWQQLVALHVRQGKAVYLSDLKVKKYEHTPYLGVRWSYELDRSVAGRELRMAGNTFDKGIGLHSESRLTFVLNGDYRRFESLVGLDERTGQGGSVRIRVLVDGRDRYTNDRELTAAAGSWPMSIDVSGGKELTLIVEFGSGGDVSDHVDWAEARLVR